MLEPLVLIVAIATTGSPGGAAASPSAAPASAPAPANQTPLKEIGRVTSSAMCTSIVIRANSAISTALRNDQTVTMAVATLRRVDLDTTNPIDKRKAVNEIDRLATDLRTSSGNAEAQVKKLRELSEQATDPERKAELKEFADALGGALFRQKRIGQDMQKMLVIMEGREARAAAHADMAFALPESKAVIGQFDSAFDTEHFNQMARAAANDLEGRTLSITADESKAAQHIVGAVNGC